MKTHVSLATTDIQKSVQFYSRLLDATPAKVYDDYALFVTENPGLELALNLNERVAATTDAHYGISVNTATDVDTAIERLGRAGLVASVERKETCCYANQSKVWAIDPEGRRWEIYAVHRETEERADIATACCSGDDGEESACCARSASS